MPSDVKPWHTLIAEAGHAIAAAHNMRLVEVDGLALLRMPLRDAYRLRFKSPAFPDVAPCWVDLDGEELAVAEERDPPAFEAFLKAKIEPALVRYLAGCIRDASA